MAIFEEFKCWRPGTHVGVITKEKERERRGDSIYVQCRHNFFKIYFDL